jgi:hypothetical protein
LTLIRALTRQPAPVIVYTIVGDRASLAHVLGDAVDMFVRRETPSASSTM